MKHEIPTILIAEDDDGHAFLVEDSLRRAQVTAPVLRFNDGEETLDFLFGRSENPRFEPNRPYLLLLDIRMPKIDGVEVLRQVKEHPSLRELPVIILTTTDDPPEVSRCHRLGCSVYIQKPVCYESFALAITQLGKFISLLQVPRLQGTS